MFVTAPLRQAPGATPKHGRQEVKLVVCGARSTRVRRQLAPNASGRLYLGVDFGTSGARAALIDDASEQIQEHQAIYDAAGSSNPQIWKRIMYQLITDVPADIRARIASIAIDGTSATTLLLDRTTGLVLLPVEMYNVGQPKDALEAVQRIAPPQHTTVSSTSALCKVMTWHLAGHWQRARAEGHDPCVLHQADYIASLLHGQRNVTDWNNSLKLGFDPQLQRYPHWLEQQELFALLPSRVVAPGAPVAVVAPDVAEELGLSPACVVCGGTTDSIAAFVAAGVSEPGQAVTSLGSTLAVKLLSETRVDDATFGVYSHRLGDSWLVGGASNTGGAVLRRYFTSEQLRALSRNIDPSRPSDLHYYPLNAPGERFPVNDPQLQPRITPRPQDDADFLHGLLEGIACVEAAAYDLLRRKGASAVREVVTAGGGAANPTWTAMRQRLLGVPVSAALHGEACYGAALLAKRGAGRGL